MVDVETERAEVVVRVQGKILAAYDGSSFSILLSREGSPSDVVHICQPLSYWLTPTNVQMSADLIRTNAYVVAGSP